MKHITSKLTLIVSALHSNKGRILIAILTIALFVISAGAPNATIGIGK
jgi:hypothetical protein